MSTAVAAMQAVPVTSVQVLALSCVGVWGGNRLKRVWPVLDRLNIPGPIVGGLIYALLILALRDRVVNFQLDLSLRDLLQNAFFTTIGFGASLKLFKVGGPQVLIFFGIATLGAVLQNVLGISLAKVLGLDPLLGIISGSVALTGGPATAAAFGKRFEEVYHVAGAQELGLASAMFGITMGGLLGGVIGGRLIGKNKLQPDRSGKQQLGELQEFLDNTAKEDAKAATADKPWLLHTVSLIALAMGLGSVLSSWIKQQGIELPSYIGAMVVAAVLRNIDDRTHLFGVSEHRLEQTGEVALAIFIVMALISLQLWQLVHLAVPLLVLLVAQLLLVWLMCVFLAFRAMGRDYESAVMAGGFCGFMLGTTANAMACMTVLTEKHGPAPRAFLVVPLVGASLIDFTNALLITQMAGAVRAFGW
jgi:ESS family glutamate:Na+ symporter